MKIFAFVLIALSLLFVGCSKSPASTTTSSSITMTSISKTTTTTSTTATGLTKNSPIPMEQSLTVEGISITVTKLTVGAAAWDIIRSLNEFNEAPEADMKYVLVTLSIKNISSGKEPYDVYYPYFSVSGSSNTEYNSSDKPVVLAKNGDYHEVNASLSHGDQITGSISYYVKQDETNLILVSSLGSSKRYFEVK